MHYCKFSASILKKITSNSPFKKIPISKLRYYSNHGFRNLPSQSTHQQHYGFVHLLKMTTFEKNNFL
jgi:hypothetical protein